MRLGWVAMLCHVYELRHETRLGCHAVPSVYERVRDMRLGWVAMLCHVYELRHETRLGCHAVPRVRAET